MTTHYAPFGEVTALQQVFEDAKKRRPARQPAHVLVVEDDPMTRRIVVNALGQSNAMISEETARDAVASYLLHAPDVVFLDIGLPDVDGFSVLDQLLLIDPEAFIVMFSSHSDTTTINKAMAAGAKGFVAKPFQKEALRNYILGSGIHHHKACM